MPRSSKTQIPPEPQKARLNALGWAGILCLYLVALYVFGFSRLFAVQYQAKASGGATTTATQAQAASSTPQPLNVAAYNQKLIAIANEPLTTSTSTSTTTPKKIPLWPVNTITPNAGALLPFNRIVAYYGNFYSTSMGVLGEYPTTQMLQMLQATAQSWREADPSTPVIPAIDYIAVTAQGSPGADGKYRLRMPADQIQQAIDDANQVNGLVILDVQVGLSTVETEVPLLASYLKLPNVEVALDPEFAMHNGQAPGTVIGSLDASDINWVANYLDQIVTANNIPPKILIVHRFTEDMVTRSYDITPLPNVEIVMDMDGWGSQAKKISTYQQVIYDEPVQFTGFKLFYKNDLRPPSTGMMTPAQVLNLTPQPLFIQYQ